ncbi:MAG TPA: NifU family protein [Gemmatimonadaceae bacterium]|nr:NifU family protein [Gemmatimonadaceae bacterium]
MLGRRSEHHDAAVQARITDALETVRGTLGVEPGAITLVRYNGSTGKVMLRLAGGCPDCGLSLDMMTAAIEAHIKAHVMEVVGVETEDSA